MPPPAQPLNVTTTPAKGDTDVTLERTPTLGKKPKASLDHASSPHELTAFVENLLEQLEKKFDDMSGEILDRMNQMSARVDAIEVALQDIINGAEGPPAMSTSVTQSPAPGIWRSGSG